MVMKPIAILILLLSLTSCAATRPWDKGDIALLIVSCAATAADIYTTDRIIDQGGYERNSLIQSNPTLGMIFFQAFTIVIAHHVPELRKPLLGTKAIVNIQAAYENHHKLR